jgi:hypothetical protein
MELEEFFIMIRLLIFRATYAQNRGRCHEHTHTNWRRIDRQICQFKFNGRKLQGYEGDTLASALLANDQMLVGRSFKYHRPRGVVASGAEEPNALINMGEGAFFEPNQRATTTEVFDGLIATSQNHWPTLEFDVGAINSYLSRFLPKLGFITKCSCIHVRFGNMSMNPLSVNPRVWAKRRSKRTDRITNISMPFMMWS